MKKTHFINHLKKDDYETIFKELTNDPFGEHLEILNNHKTYFFSKILSYLYKGSNQGNYHSNQDYIKKIFTHFGTPLQFDFMDHMELQNKQTPTQFFQFVYPNPAHEKYIEFFKENMMYAIGNKRYSKIWSLLSEQSLGKEWHQFLLKNEDNIQKILLESKKIYSNWLSEINELDLAHNVIKILKTQDIDAPILNDKNLFTLAFVHNKWRSLQLLVEQGADPAKTQSQQKLKNYISGKTKPTLNKEWVDAETEKSMLWFVNYVKTDFQRKEVEKVFANKELTSKSNKQML